MHTDRIRLNSLLEKVVSAEEADDAYRKRGTMKDACAEQRAQEAVTH